MSKIIKFDFDGDLYSFRQDGWFNATDAAAKHGRRLDAWLRTGETKKYIAALGRALNTTNRWDLIRTSRGRHGGGTWLHPKLGVAFARWISPDFAVWCDLQIDDIIRSSIQAEGNTDIVPLLLRPDAAEWELRFPPSYYQALAKVTGTKYVGHVGGTPGLYGHITGKWVYSCLLPSDVHAEIKERKNKSEKMHQWLTAGGQELLDRQIALVTNIAQSSADWKDFEARMMQVSNRGGQLSMIYPEVA